MKDHRLLLVSNRLPFTMVEKKGQIEFKNSSGGLVSSIMSYVNKLKNTAEISEDYAPVWVGTSDLTEKKYQNLPGGTNITHEGFNLRPVFLPPDMHDKYYNGFCNDMVWPLFHYFPSYAKFIDEYYESYTQANKIFCEKILEIYRPGDIIWVHDYHLMLLPAMIRKYLPDASIGFFLHIPFPSFELFRLIPSKWRKELLSGLLGADLIGFHTHDYVQHFLKSIRELLGLENKLHTINTQERSITVDTFPISVDYAKFHSCSTNNEIFSSRNKIRKRLQNNKIILSVDRLDYAKGLINRLESFEMFLSEFPDARKGVCYILQVVPSRDIIAKYNETKKEIEGLVSRINGKYGSIDWTPVLYQYKSLDFDSLVALYLAADIALITPMRDGMNLVAKEFVISRSDKRGVLILSETAGASSELGEALLVNPTDRHEIAHAIHQGILMPVQEQMRRMESMQTRLREYDVMKWAEDFLSQLEIRKVLQQKLKVKEINPVIQERIIKQYQESEKRLFLLDYDGTLSPIARLPQLAVPGKELLEVLQKLSSDTLNEIVIISGRTIEVLQKWFADLPISLVAEHGAFYKKKDAGWVQTIPILVNWIEPVLQAFKLFTERCQGSFIETKTLSLAWHYRNSEKDLGFLRSRELLNTLVELSSHLDFQVIEGHKVIEARARGIDKGKAAEVWLDSGNYEFIMAIGDDRTDEDLFKVIPSNQYSIKVGLTQSAAKYNLPHQLEVIRLLRMLPSSNFENIKATC